jgi:DNA-binding response OmpR family regulator
MGHAALRANILLVDDEPKGLFALRELLRGLDQNLVLAQSGEEALRCVLEQDFALILLDVRMPDLDGFETARLIRSRNSSRLTPIIFLTAAADEVGSMFRGYEVGAVDYLVKPLVPAVLKSKVSIFVELHRKGAELAREIAERGAAEQRARASEEKLRELAGHLISVREE